MMILTVFVTLLALVGASSIGSFIDVVTADSDDGAIASDDGDVNPHQRHRDRRVNPLRDPNEAERVLLRGLGLRKRPRPSPNATLPSFMLDLYKQMERLNQNPGLGCDLSDSELGGNVIRSFPNQDGGIVRAISQLGHQRCDSKKLLFNLEGMPSSEKLNSAEIRLKLSRNFVGLPFVPKKYKIRIYRLLQPINADETQRDLTLLTSVTELIATRTILTLKQEWEPFDATETIKDWLLGDSVNYGLLVAIKYAGRKSRELPCPGVVDLEASLVIKSTDESKCKDRLSVDGSKDGHNDDSRSDRVKRLTSDSNDEYVGDRSDRMKRSTRSRHRNRRSRHSISIGGNRRHAKSICQKRKLYVNFHEIGWSDWIIAPPGYDAFFCDGKCPFPLHEQLNATNHAIIQTLVNSVNYKKAPSACCVPTKLSPVSMLYYDSNSNVVLRQYDDMIVDGCGCR